MSINFKRIFQQLSGANPFEGDSRPSRVGVFFTPNKRPSLPFPHPWNYREPIRILESYFSNVDDELGPAKYNRYLDVPGFAPILVTRDPGIMKAILLKTSDKPDHFDRDTMPSKGIARATGKDSLLYANGALWKKQKRLSAPAFGKSSLFQPEKFQEFETTFRNTITKRINVLEEHIASSGNNAVELAMEPEIKPVMLEMLVNNFFGANVPYEEIREVFVPALESVIDNIVKDTIMNKFGVPVRYMPPITPNLKKLKRDYGHFEQLTNIVLAQRRKQNGLWSQFTSDAPDEKLRSNLKVFLAGALEATTSYATWALKHLSHNMQMQEAVYDEVKNIDSYTPEVLKESKQLGYVMEETLRLTPSLYFLPRRAPVDTWITTDDERKMFMPKGTHVLLDVWHANRLEEFWGKERTGYAASEFAPQRWERINEKGNHSREFLHFGFGLGPRTCPGKFLGQLEVSLVVGAIVKKFKFSAVNEGIQVKAGVSTKPKDGVLVNLQLR
jgi:cytochrome P450